ncbi:MAG: GAF domain-containing SpoIIE family protein phosphatase [Terracidiphilus sp.]
MTGPTLRALLNPRSGTYAVVKAVCDQAGSGLNIVDSSGRVLLGAAPGGETESHPRVSIECGDTTLGFVAGPEAHAGAVAQLLTHLAARETEQRALAAETLHLYREINLIEQLSEQLAAVLNMPAVSEAALAQAQRLIAATHGSVLLVDKSTGALRIEGSFAPPAGDGNRLCGALTPDSLFAASVLERSAAEIVNNCAGDPRSRGDECTLRALILAPLRAGQRTAGLIALASTEPDASYSAADLKLLNTSALQAAAATENAALCAEMVESARERAAYAAELQAASSVQQLLLEGGSKPTPGFQVESVYLPASEVGGDFFYVHPAPDGSLLAIVGDVSGKGLTAAMRVAMILGVLQRETSYDPAEILFNLNNAIVAKGQLGFATACCIRIALTGEFAFANAGHIAPYVSGRELETIPALPLGIVASQKYEHVEGRLNHGERLVLLSDGVPEARSQSGELFGFERTATLCTEAAGHIARTAQQFGQEDDITVVALSLPETSA